MSELIRITTAIEVVSRLKSGEISPLDCLDALESRIAEVDRKVNALPTLCFDRARSACHGTDEEALAERGVLAGLPVPIKDLTDVAGVRSTQGSPIFADRIADDLRHHGHASGRQWRHCLCHVEHAGIWRWRQHLQ